MNFKTNTSDFQKVLSQVLPAIPPKATINVLEHLKFTLKDNRLEIVATDQDITILCEMDVSEGSDGEVLVPARRLSDIVKMLTPGSEIEFILEDEGNKITLKTSNGKYAMSGLPSDEYLNLPELFASKKPNYEEGITDQQCYFTGAEISHLSNSTHFAVSTDDFRPMMSGVFFQFRGDYVNAVATDSYRLVKATIKRENQDFPRELDVIIPARAIDLLKKVNNEVWLSFVKSNDKLTHTRFDIGDMVFISRIIDEKFPAYESVIPTDEHASVHLSKGDVLKALKRVALFANPTTRQVRFNFEGDTLTVMGADDDTGTTARETINSDFSGENFEIAFNYKYVEEALNHTDPSEDDTVYIRFTGENKPFLMMPEKDSEELLNLIMPVRL